MTLVQTSPKKLYKGSTEIKAVYLGNTKIRPPIQEESIIYKMNADANGRLYISVSGFGHGGLSNAAYNWKVSVDDGAETTYTGTGSNGGKITLSGYTAGTNHKIVILPNNESYGWALAFGGWNNVSAKVNLTEIVYDGSYMGYAESATSTGDYFRYAQYAGCTSLLASPEEVLPNTVTSIGSNFRGSQFNGCSSLNEIKGWKDLSIGNSYYRAYQYYQCNTNKTIKILSDVGYASYDTNTLANTKVTTVYVPSAYLSNFTGASVQPRSSITDSKFVGY